LVQLTVASYFSDHQFQYAIVIIEDQTARKLAEAEVDELRHRLFESIEIERIEIAREIHDGPIQDLYGVAFAMSNIQAGLEDDSLKSDLRATSDSLQQVVATLRTICGELRPPTLAPFGLAKAIRSHADTLQEKFPQLNIELDLQDDDNKLPDRIRTALYRIYQQLIMNVLRHAQARNVRVIFSYDKTQARLTVMDDGQGFRVPESWIDLVREGHFGLAGIAERAESLDGDVQVESNLGNGTRIDVAVSIQ
jgi:signal transduction histidine kinase